jgi:hypothetical protein
MTNETDGKFDVAFAKLSFDFDNLEQRKAYLSQHPELLNERCMAAVDALIARWKAEGKTGQLFQFRWLRAFLRRAIEAGVEEAATEFVLSSDSAIAAVNAVMKADTPIRLLNVMSRHGKALDTKDAVSCFHFLRAKHADDKDQLAKINARWDSILELQKHSRSKSAKSMNPSKPVIREFCENQTVRWSAKEGQILLWITPRSFLVSDKPEGWTISDFWCPREEDSVMITNRQADLPPWFELHPYDVSGQDLSFGAHLRIMGSDKPQTPMNGPNIWRPKAGDRLVWVDVNSDSQPVIEIIDLKKNALVLGEAANPTFESLGTFGVPPGDRASSKMIRVVRQGLFEAAKLGCCDIFAEEWRFEI